jgi:hypothetical protein
LRVATPKIEQRDPEMTFALKATIPGFYLRLNSYPNRAAIQYRRDHKAGRQARSMGGFTFRAVDLARSAPQTKQHVGVESAGSEQQDLNVRRGLRADIIREG